MSSPDQDQQIQQLSLIEQQLNNLILQRQNFTSQLNEADSALKHVKTKPSAFKIIGNVMVETSSQQLIKELTQKKELLGMRIKNLQKQEEKLQQKAKGIQESVMKTMKNNAMKRSG